MTKSIVSVQIIPTVPQGENVYDYVDAAIKVIDEAGVKYEVHPLETTMEGEFSELLTIVQKMNEVLVAKGSTSIISQIKTLYKPAGITGETLTRKYR